MLDSDDEDLLGLTFGQYLLGYFGILVVVLGLSIFLEKRLNIDSYRSIFVLSGAMFLVVSSGRPRYLYAVIRNTGWFALISSRNAMRGLLAILGLILVAGGLLASRTSLH